MGCLNWCPVEGSQIKYPQPFLGFVLIFQVKGEGWGVILVGYQNSSRDHDEYDKKQRKNEQKDSEETFTLPIFKFVMFNQGFYRM